MKRTSLLMIALLVSLFLFLGFSISALGAEPVYHTSLVFTGRPTEAGGPGNEHVMLEQPFDAVPNTFETWIWIDPDWPRYKYPDGSRDNKRVGTIMGSFGAWFVGGGPRDESFNTNFEVFDLGAPRMYWNNGEVNAIAGDYDFRTGEWIHYAIVRDTSVRRGIFTFYMNGEVIFEWQIGAGTSVIPRDPMVIGGDYRSHPESTSGSSAWNGKIGELRVWSTARTADEIKNNMNKELEGNEDGLMGYWKFDEGEGDILHDSSTYGNHGTIFGAEWHLE